MERQAEERVEGRRHKYKSERRSAALGGLVEAIIRIIHHQDPGTHSPTPPMPTPRHPNHYPTPPWGPDWQSDMCWWWCWWWWGGLEGGYGEWGAGGWSIRFDAWPDRKTGTQTNNLAIYVCPCTHTHSTEVGSNESLAVSGSDLGHVWGRCGRQGLLCRRGSSTMSIDSRGCGFCESQQAADE